MKRERILAWSIVLVVGVMADIAIVSFRSFDSFVRQEVWVNHTYKVINSIESLFSTLKDAVTARRIYIISGDASAYRDTLSRIDAKFLDLKRLTADNPPQLQRIEILQALVRSNLGSLQTRISDHPLIGKVDKRLIVGLMTQGKIVIGNFQKITRQMESEERSLLAKRGLETDKEHNVAILAIGGGNVFGFAVIGLASVLLKRELKQRRSAELTSKRFAEELRDLYDNAPCGFHSIDADGRIVRVNETELRWLGYSRDTLVGKMGFRQLLTQESRLSFDQNFPIFKKTGILKDAEYDLVRKDGSILPISLSATAIFDEDGDYLMSRSTLFDITERRKAQEQITRLNDDLQLHAEQLEAANKEMESFSYSVSHDLRSPLRAIDGFSKILEEDYGGRIDDEGKRLLKVIRVNSQKMGNLIDDLLTFSKLGRKSMEKTIVDMEELARSASAEVFSGPSDMAKLEIAPIPPSFGDRTLLRQVWINLLSNALKFSGKNDTAQVRVEGFRGDGETVYSVQDNGAGFDMRFYNKLFGVFQRLHAQEEFSGTGVGLAIVQRVVNRHGGRVWAEGEVGKGATFFFSLPDDTSPSTTGTVPVGTSPSDTQN
ncbi:MAG: sensor histidine kinase [Sulfobacillus sp.]